ncbi:unnamed protein product [Urochloa humidicola]
MQSSIRFQAMEQETQLRDVKWSIKQLRNDLDQVLFFFVFVSVLFFFVFVSVLWISFEFHSD